MSRKKLLISVLLVVAMVFVLAGCDTTKEYTLTIKQEGEGTVTPAAGKTHKYEEKTSVNLTVKPTEGWEFSEWKGDKVAKVDEAAGKYKIVMDKDKTITAVFVKEDVEDPDPDPDPDPFVPTEPPAGIEGEPIHNLSDYVLESDAYGGDPVEDGIKLDEIGTSEVLYVNAAEGNTIAKVDPIKDFTKYSSITFYVCADSDVQIDPIAQNYKFDFFKANTVTIPGDGKWHEVSIDPTTYGDGYTNPENEADELDLTDVRKVAFEIKNDVELYMTNPVGVLKDDSEEPEPDPTIEEFNILDVSYWQLNEENKANGSEVTIVKEDGKDLVKISKVLQLNYVNYNFPNGPVDLSKYDKILIEIKASDNVYNMISIDWGHEETANLVANKWTIVEFVVSDIAEDLSEVGQFNIQINDVDDVDIYVSSIKGIIE